MKNNAQTGPFSIQDIREMVDTGVASINDEGWHSGLSSWAPLSKILPADNATDSAPAPPFVLKTAAEIRETYLGHETAIKSMGFLYYIAGGIVSLGALSFLTITVITASSPDGSVNTHALGPVPPIFLAVFFGLLAGFYFWLGNAMRRLDPNGTTPAIILAVIGLLGFPLGTLINGYFLYLLLSEQSKMVFSSEYSEVIEATPNIKHKTNRTVLYLVIFVFILTALLVAGVIFGPPR
ncbi:MAG: DUF4339 domain-containing protein [Chthoniobacteraceae bacterium]